MAESLQVPSGQGGPALWTELAADFAELQRAALAYGEERAAERLVALAVERVEGARWASITEVRDGTPMTVTSSDTRAARADAIQYELGSGPCVDAIADATVYHPYDLRHDPRWPTFGRRVADEVGMASMLSFRLAVDGGELLGGLNIYSDRVHAFGESALLRGLLIATHASAVLELARRAESAHNLVTALQSSREIGTAMGIVMAQHKVTREQAFDLLRIASQHSHRKLRDVATEVTDTGVLEMPRIRRPHTGA